MAENNEPKLFSRTTPMTPDDEIVITGISGRFPNSKNMNEFSDNLFSMTDMVDDKELRWRHTNPEIPRRMGKIHELEKFDATFFGVHYKQAHTMDPQCRLLIEHAYEAVLDAGVNPKSLRGSRTGVFVGACFAESEKTWFYEKISTGGFGITGCSRAMLANRISYTLGLTGPSFLLDTACSSSLYALDCAFNSIRNGECDAALIGGANLMLHPYVTLQFARLGLLSTDGYSRSFDNDASGYTRSEGVCVIFLQKIKDAKRIYGSVVYSKTNCDGYKEEGITHPSGLMQTRLLSEFYDEIEIDPTTIDYVEGHGNATVIGDAEECGAIDKIFCTGRKTPLRIGSIKSNMGHGESTAAACAMAKMILTFENNKIPPNINFTKPRQDIPALAEGRLKVVSEMQPFDGELVAINSFGFGGANAHALFRNTSKPKINNGAPSDSLPRLVVWSGRTEEAVETVVNDLSSRPLDIEYVALIHNIQSESTPANVFRGFGVYSHTEGQNATCLSRDVQHYTGLKRPLVWVFSGMGSQWTSMGVALMAIPIFRDAIEKCHRIMQTKGLDLIDIITSPDNKFENILHSFVGIAAIQIGIVDILRSLDMEPDHIIGHSVGELGCAYADNCFTAEQMILSAYSRGMASLETETVFGSMAAVGLGYRKIRTLVPPEIEVACHNGPDSCTISGPAENVAAFVAELKSKNIFAKEVPCSNIPYHSRYIAEMGPRLLARLNEVITEPVKRSPKWLSSSVPKIRWDQEESQYSSAYYHTNNLLSAVLFEETSAMLPNNALTIEIAPHGLLQAIVKKSMPNAVHIPLTQRGNKDNVHYFLNALGKLFTNGLDLPISRLYPKVDFPVSRGTPMISHLIRWDHNEDWFVTKFETRNTEKSGERLVQLDINDQVFEYLAGHTIDGRILFPAAAYLHLAWESLASMKDATMFDLEVEFEDVKFLRATSITKDLVIELTVMVQPGTGRFEITEGREALVTGYIRTLEKQELTNIPEPVANNFPTLLATDFYKELRLRGYHYSGAFNSVVETRGDGLTGKVMWDSNWVSFIDCLMQIQIFGKDSRNLLLPTGIQKLKIDPKLHYNMIKEQNVVNPVFDVKVSTHLKTLRCGGIEIRGLKTSQVNRRNPPGTPVLETYSFISHLPAPEMKIFDALRMCVQLALENVPILKVKGIEVDTENKAPIIQHLQTALVDLPLVTSELMFLTKQDLNLGSIHVEDGKLSTQTNCLFLIGSKCFSNPKFVSSSIASIAENAFLVSREARNFNAVSAAVPAGFQVLCSIPVENETIVLLQQQKRKQTVTPTTVIKISMSDLDYLWIDRVKAGLRKGPVVLVSEKEQFSGLIGLVNCLRKETSPNQVSCVLIDDPKAPAFDVNEPMYKSHLKLGLAINIFKNGRWGSYRHLQLVEALQSKTRRDHCYVNALKIGDLSSLTWLRGSFNDGRPKGEMVRVVYASLNYRDLMLSNGQLKAEVFAANRLSQDTVLGFEYAGISEKGRRIMGMTTTGALSTHVICDDIFTWECPKTWTMEQSATIPVVYSTVYLAFFITTQIVKGKSILIHSGTGGIGLAAIRVALGYGLEVYTTVSTDEKKQFLLKTFPQLKASNIGNSRNISFEKMIMLQTKGLGVDYVLNSLSDEKLQASIRCVGTGGKFLEIGKADIAKDSKIGMSSFLKEISFNVVLVENLFLASREEKIDLQKLIQADINSGIIQPLHTTTFKAGEVETAFRYLSSGKHVGKVLLKIRESDNDEITLPITVQPRVYCNPDLSYVIPGGLGGFGLEFADWLVLRGCRKLVLSSSHGITKQYQAYRIKLWEVYGVKTVISTADITTKAGCERLLRDAIKLGPVGGIFNLAVVLRNAKFENQTSDNFKNAMAPKAVATQHLDELARKLCPQLQFFVIFSSIACGRGTAGETNYAMANSVMERIIEQRHSHGLPAKAIQWGAVGEVGLFAESEKEYLDREFSGTLQQRIASCLRDLDALFASPNPIVSSMVIAEKRTRKGDRGNIIDIVMNIMSFRDIKSIVMSKTLTELGMDSIMAVQIRQTLDRDFELTLTPAELQELTFSKLKEYSDARVTTSNENVKLKLASDEVPTGLPMLLRNLGDETNSHETILRLNSLNEHKKYTACILLVPGIEGVAGNSWDTIAAGLNLPTFILQFSKTAELRTIPELANSVFDEVKLDVFKPTEFFYLVGYSFGAFITLELARLLEESGMSGHVVLIDGAPQFLKKLAVDQMTKEYTTESIQIMLMIGIIKMIFPDENTEITKEIIACKTWETRMSKLLEFAKDQNMYSEGYIRKMTNAMFLRLKMVLDTNIDNPKLLKSPITLIRPTEVSVVDMDEDYGLSNHTEGVVNVRFIEGNHITMLENSKLLQIINETDPGLVSDRAFKKYISQPIAL